MAKLKVISSGSSGNCYILATKEERLIIELGVPWNDILKELNYGKEWRMVRGCIASHRHSDHIKSNTLKKALSRGLRVYSSQDVHDNYNSGTIVLHPNHKYKIGGFSIQPIQVQHNCYNYAYLIEHEETGRILFTTDLVSFPYNIPNLNHILMECNYSNDIIIDKLCEGYETRSHSENHQELEDCLEALRRLNNPNLGNIMLLHLSDFGSDENMFKQRVFDEIGIEPTIASKGVEINLDKEDF